MQIPGNRQSKPETPQLSEHCNVRNYKLVSWNYLQFGINSFFIPYFNGVNTISPFPAVNPLAES